MSWSLLTSILSTAFDFMVGVTDGPWGLAVLVSTYVLLWLLPKLDGEFPYA